VIGFKGKYLTAITHSSYAKEHGCEDNELLEFIGDSVLQLCVSDLLLELYPEFSEGELTRLRHQLVDNETLASIARKLSIDTILRLGKGEEVTGGRKKTKNLANTFEALLGAIYQECGLSAVYKVVQAQMIQKAIEIKMQIPAKQRLQEWVQKEYHQVPIYTFVTEKGPAHQRSFVFSVSVQDTVICTGEGASKKKACIRAAEIAVEILDIT
jgi:ribonuclease III